MNHRNTLLALTLLAVSCVPAFADEAKLIAVLKSNATVQQKSAACRELARVATKDSVPALAALLADEKLSHNARGALETIRDPLADEALREALGKVQGRPRLGVIGSLGARRDAKAVEALAGLLASADADTAQAAARALGNIATPEAAAALGRVLTTGADANQLAVCEGLFRCAEASLAAGQAAPAQAIYDRMRGLAQAPHQVKAAALRGAVLSRGPAGVDLLLEALRGQDKALTAMAARTAMELPGPEVTAALCNELPKLPEDKQALLIATLGYRGDSSAGPALLALASKGPAAIRMSAVRNLTHLGYAAALPLLAELSLSGEGELAKAAQDCLGNFPGKDAEATILAMLGHQDAKVRGLAVQLIGQRNVAGSVTNLLKAAEDAEESVRMAALKILRQQAGGGELRALLKLLSQARSPAELQAIEAVLGAVCVREGKPAGGNIVIVKAEYGDLGAGLVGNVTKKVAKMVKSGELAIAATNANFGDPCDGRPKLLRVEYRVHGATVSKTVAEGETLAITATVAPPAIVEALCQAAKESRGEAKLALLRTLRATGASGALAAVKTAVADGDAKVNDTAARAICEWPSPEALPAIMELVRKPPTKTVKVLALRGLVRLVPQQETPNAAKAELLKEAMGLADRDEEKQLVLSGLGSVPSPESLALAAAQLGNPGLREEACVAAVTIGEKITAAGDKGVAAVMQDVAKTTSNKELAARARAVARRLKP